MCSPARCPRCQKITWTGCGQHAEQVLSRFPVAERCDCHARAQASSAQAPGTPGTR